MSFPDVGEFDKETLLAFEKEILGIYVSGHPLEAYAGAVAEEHDGQDLVISIVDEERT